MEHGSDLILDVNTAAASKGDLFFWRYNNTVNVVRLLHNNEPIINDIYKGRADFLKQNYSLLLRNVRHNDSGNYKAIRSDNEDKTIAEYTVRVQDRVSPVKLTLNSTEPESSNFTAECKTVDSQISAIFQCQNTTCHLLHQTDLKDSILNIYIQNSFVTCNHSNHVSWETDVKDFASLCMKQKVTNIGALVGIPCGSVVAAALLMCLLLSI